MPGFGVVVAVLEQNTVLLTRREDFDVWCLPGGAVDPHESLDGAAVREVYEETGLRIRLTRQVGLLSRPNWGDGGTHLVLFAAAPLSRTFNPDPAEVRELAFFPVDALPRPLLWEHGPLIRAARSGASGYVWVNRARTPSYFADRAELYAWRDESGLSRQAAYRQLMEEIGAQTLEVVLGPGLGTEISVLE